MNITKIEERCTLSSMSASKLKSKTLCEHVRSSGRFDWSELAMGIITTLIYTCIYKCILLFKCISQLSVLKIPNHYQSCVLKLTPFKCSIGSACSRFTL